ncbi:MAG: N-acetylglucosamine kinase [Bacteroidetes bacterium]|nr:N-acetylglucosamine kinase [Bacteroidota bacterium]
MLLIADSGSTKCDWVLVKDGKPFKRFSTMGFNPYFHNEAVISGTLRRKEPLYDHLGEIEHAFFYGAGCSTPELQQVVARGLYSILPNAKVYVGHDLEAAAYATYSGEPGIACILGTGSNSCFFDGKTVSEEVPALAYILGDEGSGAWYGKRLLADFLYKRLPAAMTDGLRAEFKLDRNAIMENVYMKPHANVYLASFMRFISTFKEEAYVQELIFEGNSTFLKTHVCCFANYRDLPTHFVGSVAYYFSDILYQAAAKLSVHVGTIEKKPINGLVTYHLEHQKELI